MCPCFRRDVQDCCFPIPILMGVGYGRSCPWRTARPGLGAAPPRPASSRRAPPRLARGVSGFWIRQIGVNKPRSYQHRQVFLRARQHDIEYVFASPTIRRNHLLIQTNPKANVPVVSSTQRITLQCTQNLKPGHDRTCRSIQRAMGTHVGTCRIPQEMFLLTPKLSKKGVTYV